jgi:hypothetical protein
MKILDKAQYAPLIISIGIVIYTIIDTKTKIGYDDATGQPVHYLVIDTVIYAAIALSFILALALLKVRFWKPFFTVVLVAATFSLIQFCSSISGFKFGHIKIDIFSFCLLIFHVTLNVKLFSEFLNLLASESKSDQSKPKESDIELFANKYTSKTQEELKEISESDKYSGAARAAASRIIIK